MAVEAIPPGELKTESFLHRALNLVERAGNVVPSPAIMFVILSAVVVIASAIVSWANLTVAHPATGETIKAVNLLSVEGLHRMLTSMVPTWSIRDDFLAGPLLSAHE